MEKANVMLEIAEALLKRDKELAKRKIEDNYPFSFVPGGKRKYSDLEKMRIFLRDRFIDRYTGVKLVNPGLLRAVSVYFPQEFPFHSNWKYEQCHSAYWDLVPTLDHILPVALGGVDETSNLVTTSMLSNGIKANWTLEQLKWELRPLPENEQWNGLTAIFIQLVQDDPDLLENSYIKRWYATSRKAVEALTLKI